MEITAEEPTQYWAQIDAHTAASGRTSPCAPWSVQLQVCALLGNRDIEASTATFDGTGPSIWKVALITSDGCLIRVHMDFDAEDYDSQRDSVTEPPIEAVTAESWVRRLSDVESLHIEGARVRRGRLSQPMPNAVDSGAVTLVFRDGFQAVLGVNQTAMSPYEDRGRSDRFIEALRKHTGL